MAKHKTGYCDGIHRRDFLRAGAIGASGLGLSNYLRLAGAGELRPTAKAKSAIFIYLGGGPTTHETFDMKPDAPTEIRGEFNPIATNVPGIRICEHLPELAKVADKFCLLRGVTHTLAAHDLGRSYIATGNRPLPSLFYPGYGSVVSKELGGPRDLPPFVAVPDTPLRPGFLGVQYAALETGSTPRVAEPYSVRGISLEEGVTVDSLQSRYALLDKLDRRFATVSADQQLVSGLDQFGAQAHDIIRSPRAREAFDVSLEPENVAARFGETAMGRSCLLATRLVEAGVRFVTCSMTGWDTHSNNFKSSKEKLLPSIDQGLSGMLRTLDERGLLDSTLVFVAGEFGRTPKINERAGRDHWPRNMFVMLAGGGVKMGQVLGESDAEGAEPTGEGYTPDQVAATFYHALGIDYQKEYHTPSGRPVMIVRHGSVIDGVLA